MFNSANNDFNNNFNNDMNNSFDRSNFNNSMDNSFNSNSTNNAINNSFGNPPLFDNFNSQSSVNYNQEYSGGYSNEDIPPELDDIKPLNNSSLYEAPTLDVLGLPISFYMQMLFHSVIFLLFVSYYLPL